MPDVRGALATALPGYVVESVSLLGEGLDNIAYEINNELIVRFSRRPDPERTDRETRLLTALQRISPLPVPEPIVMPGGHWFAYRKLPGAPLLDLAAPPDPAPIAATLRGFLRALHAVPPGQVIDLVDTDDQSLREWRADAGEIYTVVAKHVPAPFRRRVEGFLTAEPPAETSRLVFSHNDLGIEHVLVDPRSGAVTGVIDWSDAALVDPAYDYGLLFRDLGPVALPPGDDLEPDVRERAVFFARCSVLEDLAYGVETGRKRYADKSTAALTWLFPGAESTPPPIGRPAGDTR
jgi:aminoglycoside phosphotransferase (APT) family kinase protein